MTRPVPSVPGYRLGNVLGRGGTATVWSATRARDGLACAVKVLHVGRALEQASAEAQVLAAVDDPHVLRLIEARTVTWAGQETLALVTELLPGGSVERAVEQRGHLSPGETATVVVPLAQSLARLHAAGIVHGDITPANVLLAEDGRPVLTDLGAAAVAGERPEVVYGTEGFVAPEVVDGGRPLPASDIYSLAAVAWFALAGAPPDVPLLRGRLHEHAPGTPGPVAALVEACLAVDPQERPAAADLARDLYAMAPPEPVNLVPGADPAQALTVRLRAAGAEEAAAARPRTPRWRRGLARARRRGARYAVPLLVATGTGLLVAGTVGWTSPGREARVATPNPSSTRVVVPGTSGPVTSPATGPSTPAPAGHVPSGRSASSPGPRRPPTDAAPPPTPDAVLRAPDGPTRGAAVLLERLLARRATAWQTGEPGALAAADAPGSPAFAEDETALARARAGGVRLAGVQFRARGVTGARPVGGVAVVTAEVSRSACSAISGAVTRRVPAEPWRHVRITLSWTADGWRLRSWAPAA